MSEQSVTRPLHERDLDDKRRLHPSQGPHVVGGDAFPPMTAPWAVRQIHEWAARDRGWHDLAQQVRAEMRRQTGSQLRSVVLSLTKPEFETYRKQHDDDPSIKPRGWQKMRNKKET